MKVKLLMQLRMTHRAFPHFRRLQHKGGEGEMFRSSTRKLQGGAFFFFAFLSTQSPSRILLGFLFVTWKVIPEGLAIFFFFLVEFEKKKIV